MLPGSQKAILALSGRMSSLFKPALSTHFSLKCLRSSLYTPGTQLNLDRRSITTIFPPSLSLRPLAFRSFASVTDRHSDHQQSLHPDVSVDTAIEAACRALGRAPGLQEAELAEKLRANWFSSASDIARMSDSQAAALGFPLKLKAWVGEALLKDDDSLVYRTVEEESTSIDFEALETRASIDEAALLSDIGSETEVESDEESEVFESSEEVLSSSLDVTSAAAGVLLLDQEGWEALPIEERICPLKNRFGYRYIDRPKVVTREKVIKYSIGKEEMPEKLKTEFADLHRFGTARFFGAQADPIAEVTAYKYADHLRGMLGWLHRVRGVPLEELSLMSLVPSNDRNGVAAAFDYVQWLVNERSINVRTELLVLRSVLFAAKFLYHDESAVTLNSSDKPYSDLIVVKELRNLISTGNKASKVAPRVADEAIKWLDWPEYLNLCRELKKECALLKPKTGTERALKDVAWSVQRYLMFAILACVPDRQRTLRELQIGKTLVQEGDRWVIKHGPKDYKTGT